MRDWLKHSLQQAAWAPVLVLAAWAAADSVGLYRAIPWADKPTHFAGGLAIAHFAAACAANAERWIGPIPRLVQRLLCIGVAAVAAIGWEFAEYFCDAAFGTQLNNGVLDTLLDLFFGLLGALVYAATADRMGAPCSARSTFPAGSTSTRIS